MAKDGRRELQERLCWEPGGPAACIAVISPGSTSHSARARQSRGLYRSTRGKDHDPIVSGRPPPVKTNAWDGSACEKRGPTAGTLARTPPRQPPAALGPHWRRHGTSAHSASDGLAPDALSCIAELLVLARDSASSARGARGVRHPHRTSRSDHHARIGCLVPSVLAGLALAVPTLLQQPRASDRLDIHESWGVRPLVPFPHDRLDNRVLLGVIAPRVGLWSM